MIEVERIINKGIISKDFLKEEVQCDYLVTTERKKMWAVLLDLLIEFDKVCKKHNLKYFMYSGTLLGVVRHHGFIPWDDDIDVIMPRDDYEKMMMLEDSFQEPYFFQTPYSDKECGYTFIKIRNSNTSAVIETFKFQKFNHGIWLSVFPLDEWDKDNGEELYYKMRELNRDNSTYMRASNPNLSQAEIERVKNHSGKSPIEVYEEVQNLAQTFKGTNSEYVSGIICTGPKYQRKVLYAEDFAEVKTIKCEGMEGFEAPVPVGYDRILTMQYGDYMALPPVEERGMKHDGTIFDVDTPYKEFLKREWNIVV